MRRANLHFFRQLIQNSILSVFEGADAFAAFEVFTEKRYAGEVQRVRDFLNGHVGRFQLRFGIHHHYVRNNIRHIAARQNRPKKPAA